MDKYPFVCRGRLLETRLIHFSIDPQEVAVDLPDFLEPVTRAGRNIISLLSTQVNPYVPGSSWEFKYRYLAFRLLVRETRKASGHAFCMLKAFVHHLSAQRPFSSVNGPCLTHGEIDAEGYLLELRKGEQYLHYAVSDDMNPRHGTSLNHFLGNINRSYVQTANGWLRQWIPGKRHWMSKIDCYHFATNFFETAELLGAVQVNGMVPFVQRPLNGLSHGAPGKTA